MLTNMKCYKLFAVIAFAGLVLTSCGEEFLTSHTTHQGAAGAEATENAILSYLTATYQRLGMRREVMDKCVNEQKHEVNKRIFVVIIVLLRRNQTQFQLSLKILTKLLMMMIKSKVFSRLII